MTDLINEWPSWGESGEYPPDGFLYEGGDQVNEKHMDALWDGIDTHVSTLNTAIRNRVRDLNGDVVLDGGLVASQGSGTREVDISASSDGAYVDGEKTGSVSADTITHTTNGTAQTRTDVLYLNDDGSIGKDEGTSSAPTQTLTIAQVDVAPDDTIDAIRNYARDHIDAIASENEPNSAETGDLWTDIDSQELNARISGSYRTVAVENNTGLDFGFEGSVTLGGDLTAADGETIWDESNTYIPQGRLENDSVTVAGNSVSLGGNTSINHSDLSNVGSSDHHTRYSDSEAVNAVDGSSLSSLNVESATIANKTPALERTIPTPNSYTSGPAHGEGAGAFIGATLSPDGRVVFAPVDSSNVGIFDPATDSYTSGPAHGEGAGAFQGATLSPDGRVVFAPYDSSNVGIFDPATDSYTSGPAHGEGAGAFRGAALAPDGRVILSPFGSSNVGIFDPSDDSYTSGPAHGEGAGAFRGATLSPDGRVVFTPVGSSNVGIFDPATDSYTSGPAHGEGDDAFQGATLSPDGRVVFAPYDSSNVGINSYLLDLATASSSKR